MGINIGYYSSASSEDNENYIVSHAQTTHVFNFDDILPPPPPLLPKTCEAEEVPYTAKSEPLIKLPDFGGRELLYPQADPVARSNFPAPLSSETYLRQMFPAANVVYQRSKNFQKDAITARYFNANLCNVRKLFDRRRRLEVNNTGIKQDFVDYLEPYYKLQDENDRTLIFESRFETGNLEMACKISDEDYNLLLQNDINSKGHTQWYFFRLQNTSKNLTVRFNLLNFVKPDSLYNHGMRVLIYSVMENSETDKGWFRGGEDIMYYPNGVKREGSKTGKCYYTLSFKYTFDRDNDTIYFAYSLPYTYSKLQSVLRGIECDTVKSHFVARKTLCRSIGGNKCDYLTITSRSSIEELKNKRGIVISARVHPGETVGSWMMQGAIDFLTGDSPEAKMLRDAYIIKLVPILNPDGVINGNYRCSLIGADMNRRYKKPSSVIHPIIYNYKKMIKVFGAKYDLDLVCDLHGHSRKKNVFMYGCNIPCDPSTCKLFPFILSKLSPIFSYRDCRFAMQKSKESTMRVALFKEMQIPCIYTLEASFCGSSTGKYNGLHYNSEVLMEMGRDVCLALLVYREQFNPAPTPQIKTKAKQNQKTVVSKSKTTKHKPDAIVPTQRISFKLALETVADELDTFKLLDELKSNDDLLHNGEVDSSGSDSEPSEDNLEDEVMNKLLPIKQATSHRKKVPKSSSRKKLKMRYNFSAKKSEKPKESGRRYAESLDEDAAPSIKPKEPPSVPAPPPPIPKKKQLIGVRTYYNLSGKKVHDQSTQTPTSFYPKIAKIRAEKMFGSEHKGHSMMASPQSVASIMRTIDTSSLDEKSSLLSVMSTEKKSMQLTDRSRNLRDLVHFKIDSRSYSKSTVSNVMKDQGRVSRTVSPGQETTGIAVSGFSKIKRLPNLPLTYHNV